MTKRTYRIGCCIIGILWFLVPVGGQPLAAETPGEAPSQSKEVGGYVSLPALVAMVGNEAMLQLQDFFDAAPVTVEPFVVLAEHSARGRVSRLGLTLAEQMAAVVGNEALASRWPLFSGGQEQLLTGILQEVDGYLRVSVIGINSRGERRSYLVNIEMSEPIYRALHGYLSHP